MLVAFYKFKREAINKILNRINTSTCCTYIEVLSLSVNEQSFGRTSRESGRQSYLEHFRRIVRPIVENDDSVVYVEQIRRKIFNCSWSSYDERAEYSNVLLHTLKFVHF